METERTSFWHSKNLLLYLEFGVFCILCLFHIRKWEPFVFFVFFLFSMFFRKEKNVFKNLNQIGFFFLNIKILFPCFFLKIIYVVLVQSGTAEVKSKARK